MKEMVEREKRMDEAEQTIKELVEALEWTGCEHEGVDEYEGEWHLYSCGIHDPDFPPECSPNCQKARAALAKARS